MFKSKSLNVLLVFGLLGLSVSDAQASASPTFRLFSSAPMVIEGSTVHIRADQNNFNSAGVSLAQYRYEITRLSQATVPIIAQTQQAAADAVCPGVVTGNDGLNQICSVNTEQRRVVISAGTAANFFTTNRISLTSTVEQPAVFRVQAWLDANGNSVRDPFEPSAEELVIEVMPYSYARELVEFEFEPPLLGGTELTARIYSSNAMGSVLDQNRVQFRATEYTPNGPIVVTGALTQNFNPQINAYEMVALNTSLIYPAVYFTELLYERADGQFVLLARERFDYRSHLGVFVETKVGVAGSSLLSQRSEFGEQVTIIDGYQGQFDYQMVLRDGQNAPIADQPVYLFVNMLDFDSPQSVRFNGGRLISKNNVFDQIILKQVTDKNGEIAFTISASDFMNVGSITVDYRLNGLGSSAYSGSAGKQTVIWAQSTPKIVALPTSSAALDAVNLQFNLQPSQGPSLSGTYDVLITGEYPVEIGQPVHSQVSSSESRSFPIFMSRGVTGSGSSLVTATLVGSNGEISEAFWQVRWNVEKDLRVSATPILAKPNYGLRISKADYLPGTSILEIEGEVLNGFGSPVLRLFDSKSVELEVMGQTSSYGRAVVLPDDQGKFKTFLPVSFFEASSGQATLRATLLKDGSTVSSLTCRTPIVACEAVSQVVTGPGSSNSVARAWTKALGSPYNELKIYARDVVGAGKIQFFVNDVEIAWINASDANDPKLNMASDGIVRSVFVADMQTGKNVVEIYVDGVRIDRRIFTR